MDSDRSTDSFQQQQRKQMLGGPRVTSGRPLQRINNCFNLIEYNSKCIYIKCKMTTTTQRSPEVKFRSAHASDKTFYKKWSLCKIYETELTVAICMLHKCRKK